jgi:hypothetical protein
MRVPTVESTSAGPLAAGAERSAVSAWAGKAASNDAAPTTLAACSEAAQIELVRAIITGINSLVSYTRFHK